METPPTTTTSAMFHIVITSSHVMSDTAPRIAVSLRSLSAIVFPWVSGNVSRNQLLIRQERQIQVFTVGWLTASAGALTVTAASQVKG